MINKEQALGLVRHLLTTVGGGWIIAYLNAHGMTMTDANWTDVVAALVVVLGFVWSYLAPEKKQVPNVSNQASGSGSSG